MLFRRPRRARRGVAATELAVLLPFLGLMFVAGTDYARVLYYAMTVANCARNGAYYASDYGYYDYSSTTDAAQEDAAAVSPTPTVSTGYSTSKTGPFSSSTSPTSYQQSGAAVYVQVTVSYTFNTITNYPFVPSTVNLQRSVIMRMAPLTPYFGTGTDT